MVTSESSASAESGEDSSDLETLSNVKAKVRYEMQMLRGCEPHLGDAVEVFWEGDKVWYKGEVVESDDDSFQVHYQMDGNTLVHSRTDGIYQYRLVQK